MKSRPFSSIAKFHISTLRLFSSNRPYRTSFKGWRQLSNQEKQLFINKYIELYKEKHPCSKSNVMYRSLAEGMEEYDDAPYVFGVIYNEIRAVVLDQNKDSTAMDGALGDPEFHKLLLK